MLRRLLFLLSVLSYGDVESRMGTALFGCLHLQSL